MDSKIQILIVDDEKDLIDSLVFTLQSNYQDEIHIEQASDGQQALDICKAKHFDLVLMDVKMPNMDGITALREIKSINPQTFVVILTAHANLRDAVEAIKEGAYDYLEKPINKEKLIDIYDQAKTARKMVSDLSISLPIFDDDIHSDFISDSTNMKEIFSLVHKVSKVDTTVLIRGENGTGKELVAQAIHYNSPRKLGKFVAINCGALPEGLIESELFGHEKGAFTGADERKIGKFQLASEGTLFLDEIAELKPEIQVKLLRVLQEKRFSPVGSNRELTSNARIIAATNQNLEKMIMDANFRDDLFYRLNVMPVFLPPLRERVEDIPRLVDLFLNRYTSKYEKPGIKISEATITYLKEYKWPGNIRELENTIERIVILSTDNQIIEPSSIPDLRKRDSGLMNFDDDLYTDFEKFKQGSEKEFIVNALQTNLGKINQTVANANIPKNTLLRKIKKYGINPKDYAK